MSVSVHSHSTHSRSQSQHLADPFLDQIFSAVQLPKVQNEEIHDNNIKAEQESILAELDQVLQKQRSLSESSKSSSNTLQEVHEHNAEHFYDDVASENHYDTIPGEPEPDYEQVNDEPPVPNHRSYDSLAAEEIDEFPEIDNRPIQAELASLRHLQLRSRSQTVESQASAAESRFGNFEVQDENGRYKGSQIDLYHNEVAYNRPKKQTPKGVSESKSEAIPKATPRQSFNNNAAERRQSINSYVKQVNETRSRRSSVISLAKSIKEQPKEPPVLSQNGKATPIHVTNGNHAKKPSTFNGTATLEPPVLETIIEFNETVVEQLENSTLLHEINGYGIVQPSFTEYYHEKFRHFIIGNNHKEDSTEEEKVVLLLGESGVGKTTFVYSAANYLYGVEREYDFRFAIEPHNEIQPTRDQVNIYTFCNTVLNQKISIIDTPGIEIDHSVEIIKQFIKHRLTKRPQFKIDGIVVLEKQGESKSNPRTEAKYRRLETLLGGDIRSLTIPAYTFANNYATVNRPSREFPNLPFTTENFSLFNSSGFFPSSSHKLQQLINFKTSVASFDELFFAINFKLHAIVLARRQ